MTDSLSMVNHLAQAIEARLASGERDVAMLRTGQITIQAQDGADTRDLTQDWITRLDEWIALDRQHLARLPA